VKLPHRYFSGFSQQDFRAAKGHSHRAPLISHHLTWTWPKGKSEKRMVGMVKRLAVFMYGLVSYVAFFATFVYAVGFIGNLYVPKSMDSAAQMSFGPALGIDALLLLLFAVQHSLMARPAFKEVLTRLIPAAAERSTYVLCSSLLLIALFAFWQPIGGVVWNFTNPVVRNVINTVFGLGFALVFVATLLINHFDLFGLRQVALYLARKPYTYLEFRTPLLPLRASSSVRGLVDRLLGYSNDDRRTPSVRSADVRLHSDGDPLGRARYGRRSRFEVSGISEACAQTDPVVG